MSGLDPTPATLGHVDDLMAFLLDHVQRRIHHLVEQINDVNREHVAEVNRALVEIQARNHESLSGIADRLISSSKVTINAINIPAQHRRVERDEHGRVARIIDEAVPE